MPPPLVIAHRGGRGAAENSLAAVRGAIMLGADGVEIDVMRTADGLAVYHDARLNPKHTRRRDGGPLARTPLAQLRLAELADYEVFAGGNAQPLASFTELCATIAADAPPDFQFYVELKSSLAGEDASLKKMAGDAVGALREHNLLARTTMLSFDWRLLEWAREAAPDLPLACTTFPFAWTDPAAPLPKRGKSRAAIHKASRQHAPWWASARPAQEKGASHGEQLLRAIARLGARAWCAPYQSVTAQYQELAQSLGLQILAWTVDKPTIIRRLQRRKVHALITNVPELALR